MAIAVGSREAMQQEGWAQPCQPPPCCPSLIFQEE